MVGSPPANAGDAGSIPGPGGSRVPWSSWAPAPQLLKPAHLGACAPQLLSPCAATLRPAHLEPVLRGKRGHQGERPVHHSEDPVQPKK